MADLKDMLARAKQRASETVETWVPTEAGDNNGGVIESINYISFSFENRHRKDGLTPSTTIRTEDGALIRYNWMGTLPEQSWERIQPQIGDIVWIHHHGTSAEKEGRPKGYKPYEVIETLVIDPATGHERIPDTTIKFVDSETGEVLPAAEEDQFALKPGEEKF